MASKQTTPTFPEQIKESRKNIRDSFKRSHEALQMRENILLSRVDEIEKEYNSKTQEMDKLVEALNKATLQCEETLAANILTDVNQQVHSTLDKKIHELTADTDSSIEFEWDKLSEIAIEQLGSIKVNGQIILLPVSTFPPHVKPVVPDYKTKQLPTAYFCKNSSEQKSPGELNKPRCIAIHYKSGTIYIADRGNHRVQVFSCNGDYLFMFGEKMDIPVGICISQNKVFVSQFNGNCINKYELEVCLPSLLVISLLVRTCSELNINIHGSLASSTNTLSRVTLTSRGCLNRLDSSMEWYFSSSVRI